MYRTRRSEIEQLIKEENWESLSWDAASLSIDDLETYKDKLDWEKVSKYFPFYPQHIKQFEKLIVFKSLFENSNLKSCKIEKLTIIREELLSFQKIQSLFYDFSNDYYLVFKHSLSYDSCYYECDRPDPEFVLLGIKKYD